MKFSMGPVAVPASGAPPSGIFVGESHSVTGASTTRVLALPPGTVAGDLVIVMVQNIGTPPTIPGGYTSIGAAAWAFYGYRWAAAYKVMVAGDITTGTVTMTSVDTSAPMIALAYRGPTVATLINENDAAAAGASDVISPGFTKAGGSDGVVSIVMDRDPSGTPTAPGLFTARTSVYYSTFFAVCYADIAAADYVDGTDVTWTTFAATFYQHAWLIELT